LIPLYAKSEPGKGRAEEQKVDISGIDFKAALPADIDQLGNLLECGNEGCNARNAPEFLLNSSNMNSKGEYTHHHWHFVGKDSPSTDSLFTIDFAKTKSVRRVQLEYILRKKETRQIDFTQALEGSSAPSFELEGSEKNIPLVVRYLTGAQTKDSVQPSILLFPDEEVFSSNYPQPEFIFSH